MHEYSFSVCFMCAKSLQWCLTLCNPMDCTLPGFSVHKISQARILEWVAMPFSRGSSPPRDGTHVSLCFLHWQGGSLTLIPPRKPPFSMLLLLLLLSHFSRVRLCVTPSLGFSRQEHWSGLPFPSPMHKKSEKWKWSHSAISNSSRPHGLQPTRLLHPWDFPGKSTGVACHCLLHSACYQTPNHILSFWGLDIAYNFYQN